MTGPEPVGQVVVIGVGSQFRRDDGIGPEVIRRLHGQVPGSVRLVCTDGDPAALIEAWAGAATAVVVDAVRVDPAVPGRLHRLELDQAAVLPEAAISSHGLGLGAAVGLARALDRMPGRLIIHAAEAADLRPGSGLSPAVAAVAGDLTRAVLADLPG